MCAYYYPVCEASMEMQKDCHCVVKGHTCIKVLLQFLAFSDKESQMGRASDLRELLSTYIGYLTISDALQLGWVANP